MAVSIGLFASLLVSVTLLPTLYRVFHRKKSRFLQRLGRQTERLNALDYGALYEKGFRLTMRKQGMVLASFFCFAVSALVLFLWLPKRQLPELTSTEAQVHLDWNEPINAEENKRRILELLRPLGDTLTEYNAQIGQQQFLLDRGADTGTPEASVYVNAGSQERLAAVKVSLDRNINAAYPGAVVEYGEVDNIFNLVFSRGGPPLTARLRNVENGGAEQNARLKELWNALSERLRGTVILAPITWEEHITLWADNEKNDGL